MGSHLPSRLDRAVAAIVLSTLLSGVGALGWLVGHMLTYDATGRHHQHQTHEYMRPLEQGGTMLALVGIVTALVAILLWRDEMSRWVDAWRRSGGRGPWIAAAAIPALTFVGVEAMEGSIAQRGLDLLAYGIPLQVAIGVVVLAMVRSLLGVLVLVADRIAGTLRDAPLRGVVRATRPIVRIHPLRVAPMAVHAALRAPPRHVP